MHPSLCLRCGGSCPPEPALPPAGTCHHDGADARSPQSLDDRRGLGLQQVPQHQQPQEVQLPLHGIPAGCADLGQRSRAGPSPQPRHWARPAPRARLQRAPCRPCRPDAQFPGRSPPRQLLSGLQAGCDGQRLAGEGHDAVASGRVVLQRLGEVWGHCRGQAGVTGTRRWGPGRRRGARPILGRGPPPSPVSGLQRLATSSGEPLT